MNQRVVLKSKAAVPASPRPRAADVGLWPTATRVAVAGLFLLALLAVLAYARPLLLPVAIALVFGTVLMPALTFAARAGIPHWTTALVLVTGMVAALSYGLVLLADPVREWIERAPEFGAILSEKLRILDRPLVALQELQRAVAGPQAEEGASLKLDLYTVLLQPAFGVLTPALGQLTVFFGTCSSFWRGARACACTSSGFGATAAGVSKRSTFSATWNVCWAATSGPSP